MAESASEEQEIVTVFLECARYGELDDVKAFISERPDLVDGARNEQGTTALHMASANGHMDIVRLLLQHPGDVRARVNARNGSGSTALHWAAMNDRSDVVKALIDAGADPRIQTATGKTALYEAQQRGAEKVAVRLLEAMVESDIAPPNITEAEEEPTAQDDDDDDHDDDKGQCDEKHGSK